jgi:hypothetical protein
MNIKDCFKEDFTEWLLKSNNQSIKKYTTSFVGDHQSKLDKLVEESLQDILDILLKEPDADYFWYGHPEHSGELSYSLPRHDALISGINFITVPGDSLRVDGEKVKVFLRDYKINSILN